MVLRRLRRRNPAKATELVRSELPVTPAPAPVVPRGGATANPDPLARELAEQAEAIRELVKADPQAVANWIRQQLSEDPGDSSIAHPPSATLH